MNKQANLLKLINQVNEMSMLRKKANSFETADTEASELIANDENTKDPSEGSFAREESSTIKENVPNSVENAGNEPASGIPKNPNNDKSEANEDTLPTTGSFKEPGSYYGSSTGESELRLGKSGAAKWRKGIEKVASMSNELIYDLQDTITGIINSSKQASYQAGSNVAEEDIDKTAAAALEESGFDIALNAVHLGSVIGEKTAAILKLAEEVDEAAEDVASDDSDDISEDDASGDDYGDDAAEYEDEAAGMESPDGNDVPVQDVGGEDAAMDMLGEGGDDEAAQDLMAEDDNGGSDVLDDIDPQMLEEFNAALEENPELVEMLLDELSGEQESDGGENGEGGEEYMPHAEPDGDEGLPPSEGDGDGDEGNMDEILSQLEGLQAGGGEEGGGEEAALPKMGSARRIKSAKEKYIQTLIENLSRTRK